VAIAAAAAIDRTKALADKRSDASITDADWAAYINWGIEDLYRLLVSVNPEAYFSQQDFTLTGTAAGAVFNFTSITGTGLRAIHGLDVYPDTNQRRTIGRRNFRERNQGRIGWWSPTTWATDRRYDVRGRTLVITPYEIAGAQYRIYFRAAPYKFSGPTDVTSMDAQMEIYDEWVAIKAAMKGLKIEESDTNPWREELELLRESIVGENSLDDGDPSVIADVEANTWLP
jgi:hypothetical protein